MSDLVSGEAVLLDLQVAKLASRGLALALDVLIQAIVLVLAFMVIIPSSAVGFDTALDTAITLVVVVLVLVGYPAISETLTRGRTIGKAAAGLRVVRTDGGPIRFRHAIVRALAGFFVDFWGLGMFGAVAVIVSLSSKNGQRVGDLLAGTFVVRERVPEQQYGGPVHMPPPLANWAATLPVSALPNDLALAIRQYLGRLHQLTDAAASSLGYKLATEARAHLGIPMPSNVPIPEYLTALLAERRNREEGRSPNIPQSVEQPPQINATPPDSPFAPPS